MCLNASHLLKCLVLQLIFAQCNSSAVVCRECTTPIQTHRLNECVFLVAISRLNQVQIYTWSFKWAGVNVRIFNWFLESHSHSLHVFSLYDSGVRSKHVPMCKLALMCMYAFKRLFVCPFFRLKHRKCIGLTVSRSLNKRQLFCFL